MRISSFLMLTLLLAFAGCSSSKSTAPDADRSRTQPMNRADDQKSRIDETTIAALEQQLIARHGEGQRERIHRGLAQVVARWRPEDGDVAALQAFVAEHFLTGDDELKESFAHLEYALEMLDGHANEVGRELSRFLVLDEGPVRPVDRLLAAYSPTAHITEDLFKRKIAFVALLNFPLVSPRERLQRGASYDREKWAAIRLTGRFEHRVPPEVLQEADRVSSQVESYIDSYNVHMDRLVAPDGSNPFKEGLKLISHWGLRDEIRGLYPQQGGLERQRMIARVMDRIVRQEIPAAVVDSPELEWDPHKNLIREPGKEWREAQREQDERYRHLLEVFRSRRDLDPHYPDAPSHIKRVFLLEREIPEKRMKELLESVVSSPITKQVGALVSKRLGRPLEPFDIWYTGFRPKSELSEPELDRMTRARFPTAKAFQDAIPDLLAKLDFTPEVAQFLGQRIVVDGARGAGHAHGPKRRDDAAHLRTRIGPEGLTYKGYNIAIHELGHNVEQVFSMARVDHTLLEGVPNTGFTEAFAFLFQARDLELLGVATDDPQAAALHTLDRFWAAYEIAGVALLDMAIWRWMYDHPEAAPAELREATVQLAKRLWNRYYAPVFGVKDQALLAIYSHIIAYGLYTPDYPLGKLITFQIEQYLKDKKLGAEMERMCRLGRLTPDVWMQQAVGERLSSRPLLEATRAALKTL